MRCPSLSELAPSESDGKGWPLTVETPTRRNSANVPRVTIVTPSFNQGHYLEKAIRSVLLQGYPDLEYIVIDGGSTDNSIDILRKYEPWVTAWVSEPDNGQASAINKGFRKSTGQIMGWLNSDDGLKPDAVWQVVSTFQRLPQCAVVCGFREAIDVESKQIHYLAYPKPDRFTLSRVCYVPQETVFWRRSVWESVGELDESFQFALDYDLWQRILAAGYQFHLIPRFIGMFHSHADAKHILLGDVRARELAIIYRRYLGTEKSESELRGEIHRAWFRRMYGINLLARFRILHLPWLANVILNALALDEKAVVNVAAMQPRG